MSPLWRSAAETDRLLTESKKQHVVLLDTLQRLEVFAARVNEMAAELEHSSENEGDDT